MEKISENTMDRLMLNLKMIKASFVVPALMMLPAISGHAAENGNYSFPAGASLYLIGGFPPVPGNYLQVMAAHTDSSRLNNSRGDEIKGTDFDLKVNAATVRFFTVWDSHIFGADSFASELIGTYAHAKNSMNTPDGHFSDSQDGLGDIIIGPFLFQWDLGENKNWHAVFATDYVIPTGSYSKNRALNVSNNRFSIQPIVALRYESPLGFELGVEPRLSFNWKNQDTNYKTGTEVFVEYMAAYKIGQWKAGVSGYYADQLEEDELNGKKLSDSKTKGFGIGPTLQYQFPNHSVVIASWQKDIVAENKSENNNFYLTYMFKY